MPVVESYAEGTPCYVELMTPDLDGAGSFYAGVLGWQLAEVPFHDGGRYLVASHGGHVVTGIGALPPQLDGHPAFWQVYLATDDADAAAARVVRAGGTVQRGPVDVSERGRMVEARDPTGVRFHLWQAGSRIGSALVNEPGGPVWNELLTPDLPAATAFYTAVLGVAWETVAMPGGEYTLMVVADRAVAGAQEQPRLPAAEGPPPHWNVYFAVASCADTVTLVERLGGRVLAPPFDMPSVGRIAVLSDPQQGLFCVLQELPDPAQHS